MGLTLRHRAVLCCTFHPWDRHKDMWNRDRQTGDSTAVSQCGSSGAIWSWLHTHQGCADALPLSQSISQHLEKL